MRSWSIKEDREKQWEIKEKEVEADIMRQRSWSGNGDGEILGKENEKRKIDM